MYGKVLVITIKSYSSQVLFPPLRVCLIKFCKKLLTGLTYEHCCFVADHVGYWFLLIPPKKKA